MESRPKLPEIPLDIIKQILSWLPVESLLRFKCVHKEWHSLIQDPGFIKLHTDRAWRGTPVLLPYTRDTDDDSFYLVDYHAGLVVEMSAATGRYQIRNPATRQVVDLPDPHPITLSMLAAFDWRSRECKLLARYSVGEEDSIEYKWEILSVGTDEHWRALNWGEEEDVQVVTQHIWRTTCGIHFVDRIQYGNHQPHWDVKVVSVDICRETFQVNALPQRFRSVSSRGIFSIMWDDCQSLADVRDEELHFFVLKKYEDNYRWSDTKIIFPWRFLQEIGYNFNDCRIIYGRADDMWLQFNDNVEICCDVETGRIKEQILPKEVNQNGCYYQPSLVALRGMRPEDSQG